MKKIYSLLLCLGLISFSLSASATSLIQGNAVNDFTQTVGNSAGFQSVSIGSAVSAIIKIVLSFLGIIFLILTIVAGFKWMTAGGNEDQVKKAVDNLKNAIIGLIIILAAYAITFFVFKYIPLGITGDAQVQTSG